MMYYIRWLIYRRFRLAAELRHNAKKLLQHQKDLLTSEGLDDIQNQIDYLTKVMRSPYNREELDAATEKLQQIGSHRLIPYKNAGIRENVEVCLFAVGIAMGIRTFFFQPMGIPTGSMQPTLYGITHSIMGQGEDIPGAVSGFLKKWLNGISYYQLKAEGNWKLHDIESQRPYLFLFTRQRLVFQDLDTGQLITKDVNPPLGSNGKSLLHSLKYPTRFNNDNKNITYPKGSDVFKVRRESGDHLLVNRFVYNFRIPKRGEIIVFETKNITGIRNDKLFYIKRLVGLPNEKLDIKNRHVYINDKIIDSTVHPFEFIYSMDLYDQHPNDPDNLNPPAREHLHDEHPPVQDSRFSGHQGFGHPIKNVQNVQIPSNQYYALGDNTFSSEDSRSWGTLPGKNIFGTPSFIYWPFFSQPDREVRPHRFGWAFQ